MQESQECNMENRTKNVVVASLRLSAAVGRKTRWSSKMSQKDAMELRDGNRGMAIHIIRSFS
jgi:hypothetical protein